MNLGDLTSTRRLPGVGVLAALGPFGERVARREAFEPAVRELLRATARELDLAGLEIEAHVGGLGDLNVLEGETGPHADVFRLPGGDGVSGSVRAHGGGELGVEEAGTVEAVAAAVSLALTNLHLYRALESQKAHLSAIQVASEALGTVLDEDKLYKTVLVLTLELLDSKAGVIFPGDSRPAVRANLPGSDGEDPVVRAIERLDPGGRRALRAEVEGGSVVGAGIGRSGGYFYMFRRSPAYTQDEEDTLRLVARQLARAQERSRLYQTIESATLEVTESLAAALESRDGTTGRHINRTQEMVESVARGLGLDAGKVRAARFAAVLHDIGKIGVPDAVLNKPGTLDAAEWEIMRRHPDTGARILSGISGFERVADAVGKHHERFDGRGYPRGIAGEDIPVEARVISVVDAFDAMTNDRPYRRAIGQEEALEELEKEAGKQFDPVVVGALRRLIEGPADVEDVESEAGTDA